MNHPKMMIGEAAAQAGVSAKAVRLYESKGLIEPPERTAAGYRTYAPDDVATLQFIRQAKTVGLTLDDIKRIIDLQRDGQQPCSTVIELLDQRIADIDTKLADLRALRESLSDARHVADAALRSGEKAIVCRIIESTQARHR